MDKVTNFFNLIFLVIILFLSLMSLIALFSIHWTLFNTTEYSISFNPIGINNYLSAFESYKTLFTATITTIAAYLGLLRLKAATEANKDKYKQDRFNEWKAVLDNRFISINNSDPHMNKGFIKFRYNLFCRLYELNFKISNKEELTQIFTTTVKEWVTFFEDQNKAYNNSNGVYKDQNHSFSFDSFFYLFMGCADNTYSEIYDDLKILYLSGMSNERIIDNEWFIKNNSLLVDYSDL